MNANLDFPSGDIQLFCSNWSDYGPACTQMGTQRCPKCYFVMYCSESCRKEHECMHQHDCDEDIVLPNWVSKFGEDDPFPGGFVGSNHFVHSGGYDVPGNYEIVFNNISAFDLLQLTGREGAVTRWSMRILSVAGDIRHVIKTIVSLPEGYRTPLNFVINDADLHNALRNLVLVFAAFIIENVTAAVDFMIHVWYSPFLRRCHKDVLCSLRDELKKTVDETSVSADGSTVIERSWTFGQQAVRVVMDKASWLACVDLLRFPCESNDMTQQAMKQNGVPFCDMVSDQQDMRTTYHRRVALAAYWQHGVIASSGADLRDFDQPNPLLYNNDRWLPAECGDPIQGWNLSEVLNQLPNVPTADLYDKLLACLQGNFSDFIKRARQQELFFEIRSHSVYYLHKELKPKSFARIYLCDELELAGSCIEYSYLVQTYGGLLETVDDNSYATLIALFPDPLKNATLGEVVPPTPERASGVGGSIGRFFERQDNLEQGQLVVYNRRLPDDSDLEAVFERYTRKDLLEDIINVCGMEYENWYTPTYPWATLLPVKPEPDEGLDLDAAGIVAAQDSSIF